MALKNLLKLSIVVTTESPLETRQLGENIGKQLKAGMVVALNGDLGSGKTVFVQGLARGLDVLPGYYVTSPSYTLINEYPGRHTLFHVDLYRLEDLIGFEDIGLYEILHGKDVVAVEWAERLLDDLPAEYILVQLEILGDESRKIHITGYGLEPITLLNKIKKS